MYLTEDEMDVFILNIVKYIMKKRKQGMYILANDIRLREFNNSVKRHNISKTYLLKILLDTKHPIHKYIYLPGFSISTPGDITRAINITETIHFRIYNNPNPHEVRVIGLYAV